MKKIIIIICSLIYFFLLVKFTDSYYYNPFFLFFLFFGYYIFIYYIYKSSINVHIPLITVSIIYFSLLVIRFYFYNHPLFKFNNYLFILVLLIFHYLVVYSLKNRSLYIFSLFLIFNFFFSFYIYYFFNNYLLFGTYFGEYNYSISNDLVIHDVHDNLVTLDDDKTYVIDIWSKGCGVCFLKFPIFEKLKNKYENQENIKFVVLNLYNDKDNLQELQIQFDDQKLDLNNYYISKKYSEDLQTYLVPTVLVIKNRKIIFKGNVETLNVTSFYYLK